MTPEALLALWVSGWCLAPDSCEVTTHENAAYIEWNNTNENKGIVDMGKIVVDEYGKVEFRVWIKAIPVEDDIPRSI